MPSAVWYYTRGSKRFGPVSVAELRQLAEHGELGPEELVWREGLDQWVPARRVKGLFNQEDAATAKGHAGGEASGGGGGEGGSSGTKPDNPLRAEPANATEPARPAPAPAPPRLPSSTRPARAAFEASAAAFERAREGRPRHLFDLLLESGRTIFHAEFVYSTATLFRLVGHYTLYLAMLLWLGIQMALAVKHRSLWPVGLGLGGTALLAVLHYVASRLFAALERLDRATACRMPSPVFLDAIALLNLLASLGSLVGLTIYGVSTQDVGWILPAVIGFILFQYLAVVALNPESLNLTMTGEATAGEEAIGILSFGVKLGLHAVPVVFGVGAVWGTFVLVYAVVLLAVPSLGPKIPPDMGPDCLTRWLLAASPSPPDQATAGAGAVLLIASAASPLVAYLWFLLSHLSIEFLRAVLALPGKLESAAENRKTGDLLP